MLALKIQKLQIKYIQKLKKKDCLTVTVERENVSGHKQYVLSIKEPQVPVDKMRSQLNPKEPTGCPSPVHSAFV